MVNKCLDGAACCGDWESGSGGLRMYPRMPRLNLSDAIAGFTAMLVALPSAIAFGLVVYAPLGPSFAPQGALAGILGAVAIGLFAPIFGGAPRLVSAPCAPAAAVLAALVVVLTKPGTLPPEQVPVLIALVIVLAGLIQLGFGFIGGGRLIKYVPYPVVAGYLSGVGILIILGQLPKFFGLAKGTALAHGLSAPTLWSMPSVVVGVASIAGMQLGPRLTRRLPAPILAVAAGLMAYALLGIARPELRELAGNALVIGPIGAEGGMGMLETFKSRWDAIWGLKLESVRMLLTPALTLAVLLGIDTLKTCVVVDALTKSRHNSNRELIGQGIGNLAAGLVGGMAGAGTSGATLVNLNSGAVTKLSGFFVGVFSLAAFLLLGKLVAWVPFAALAGILLVVGFRMVDRHSFKLLRQRSTVFDFLVVAAVVVTAVSVNLIAASGVGVALAILLFLREQIRGSVVRRRTFGNQVYSKKRRLPHEITALEKNGGATAIFELQGSLFFGTADQLLSEIEPHLAKSKYIVLELRRVQGVDFTASHVLELIAGRVGENKGSLIFANLPASLPTGQDLIGYLTHVGLVRPGGNVRVFPTLDDALEWTEDRILEAEGLKAAGDEPPLGLSEIHVLSGLPAEAIKALRECVEERSFGAGQKIFSQGDTGDEMFLIRRGTVRILLPLAGGKYHHLLTTGRGDFFGDMAFLDKGTRSADAVAADPTDIYVISRSAFERVAAAYPALSGMVLLHLARVLAVRLRHTDAELRVLEDA